MGGGSSGVSGKVEFVDYIEDTHINWLLGIEQGEVIGEDAIDNSIVALMNAAMAGVSPFYNAEFSDPESDLTEVEDAVGLPASDLFTLAEALNNLTDWDAALANAKSKADTNITDTYIDTLITALLSRVDWGGEFDTVLAKWDATFDDDEIDAKVESFERISINEHQRAIARFAAGLSDINAVQGSAFTMGMALIESDRLKKINQFRIDLQLMDRQSKVTFLQEMVRMALAGKLEISKFESLLRDAYQARWQGYQETGTAVMMNALQYNKSYIKLVTDTLAETRRIKIVGTHEFEARELDLDVQDSLYDIKIFREGASLLGAPSGMASALPEKDSVGRSALGGILAGAGAGAFTGAQIGAAGGPITATGGAAIGALLGIGQAFL